MLVGQRLLELIGNDLDSGGTPRVADGGVVMPDSTRWGVIETELGGGVGGNAFSGAASWPERSEAGSREGSAGQGPAAGPAGPTGATAPQFGASGLEAATIYRLERARRAYPQLSWRLDPPYLWSYLWIRPILGLPDSALLINRNVVERPSEYPVSWAWWNWGIRIGPRHTNVGFRTGGSICAFDRTDGIPADELIVYFDLVSLWITRQLFLSIFHRWPGRQVLHTAHERLRDQQPGELCGCLADTGLTYDRCCRDRDITIPHNVRVREYLQHFPYPIRAAPDDVIRVRQAIWV